MNARRRLIALGAAVLLGPRILVAQQQMKVHRVAFVAVGSPTKFGDFIDILKRELRDLGYIEGQNIVFDMRWTETEGEAGNLRTLTDELVALKPDVILAVGTPPTGAAKQATTTIPIVMISASDPVGSGYVASLAHPGGNITGVSNMTVDLSGKMLELIHTLVPKATRIAVLISDNPIHTPMLKQIQDASERVDLKVFPARADSPEQLGKAFALMTKEKAKAAIILLDNMFLANRKTIAELAIKANLPTISYFREHTAAGGLVSYGPRLPHILKLAATYIDKILKGSKPRDLPIQQPTEFELVVNLKTAKALGITIPQEILLRADKVIE